MPERVIEEWVSSCCAKAMTTAGGDGTHESSCWAVCLGCSMPCGPVAIYAEPAALSREKS